MFTKNVAYAEGYEDVLGTIESGKFADLTVMDEDPFQIKPERIKEIRVDMTLVAGEKVYESSFPQKRKEIR